MGFDTQDKELVRLLTKLKNADGKYPPDLLAARRQGYLKQMGEVGMGIGAGIKIKNAIHASKTPALSSTTSTVLESALVAAIVAETGTVAYFYRDKLADIFQSVATDAKTEEVTPASVNTEDSIQGVTASQAVPSTLPSSTLSPSSTATVPTGTPIPDLVDDETNTTNMNSTPAPNGSNGNNGNHYGQTPKPDRTKEPKGSNDPAPKDQPPKDKPPKNK